MGGPKIERTIMPKTTVLVCGGRDYADSAMVDMQLDRLHALHGFGLLIHGGAKGADAEADRWAKSRRIPVKAYPADWKTLGKKAGPVRNQTMLTEGKPDWVVGFPGEVNRLPRGGRFFCAWVWRGG
jgi:hypothetical protein